MRFGLGHGSAEFSGDGLAGFGAIKSRASSNLNVGPREIEHAAVGVIEGGSQIGEKLALQNQAHAAGGEIVALVAEGAGRYREDVAGVGREIPDAG